MTLIATDIQKAIAILDADELVAIPTETVYGLAGNIYSETALEKIFTTKQRPMFNPLIVHLHSAQQLNQVAAYVPRKAQLLAEAFWPGPLTLVLPKTAAIPDAVTAGKPTVAVRIPNHPLTLDLLKNLDYPIAAPSANPSGSISPTNAQHVKDYFDGKIQMVLDGGPCLSGVESTIVGFDKEEPVVYRLGSTSIEAIEGVVGPVQIQNRSESNPTAPGMLSRHYAPKKTTLLSSDIDGAIAQHQAVKVGILVFDTARTASNVTHQEVLSIRGDLEEATAALYAALHRLDKADVDLILCQRFPAIGLGKTINDRLERAAKR